MDHLVDGFMYFTNTIEHPSEYLKLIFKLEKYTSSPSKSTVAKIGSAILAVFFNHQS